MDCGSQWDRILNFFFCGKAVIQCSGTNKTINLSVVGLRVTGSGKGAQRSREEKRSYFHMAT